MKHIIDLAYKLTGFFHTSAVSGEETLYASTDGKYISTADGTGRFPCTRTIAYPVAMPAIGSDDDAKYGAMVPVLAPNGHRGRLRRFAAKILFELLAARGEKLGLDAYHVATCGAPSGVPDGKQMKISESVAAMRHPYVGLFGGGRRFTLGSLSVGIGWPVHPLTLETGLVSEKFREHAVAHTRRGMMSNQDTNFLTANIAFTRKDDVLTFTNGVTAHIEDADVAITGWLKMLEEGVSRKKAKKSKEAGASDTTAAATTASVPVDPNEDKKKSLSGVAFTEAVIPGVTMASELIVDDSMHGMAGLGLLIHAVARFANEGQHGGKKNVGMGRFAMVICDLNGTAMLIKGVDGCYEPNMENPEVASACDAWAEYAATVTAANLTAVLLT